MNAESATSIEEILPAAAAVAIATGRHEPAGEETSLPTRLEHESDRNAFVDEHYERLYRWLWWLTGSAETAADLTQDSFAAFFSSLEERRVQRPPVWLFRIARNRWRKWCRDRRPSAGNPDEALADLVDPADDAVRTETARRVIAAVADLPRSYREAVTLRYWGGLSHGEIASVLGITAPLARWRLFHGKRLLRERIDEPIDRRGDA